MPKGDHGPQASPGFWLHHAALAWRAELDTRLRECGLTPTQFLMLASIGWLAREGTVPTQQEVAEHAGADRMMTSKVVRALEERGLLVREAHESDARALRLRLTGPGRELTAEAIRIARHLDEEFFGAEPEDLRDTLRSLARSR